MAVKMKDKAPADEAPELLPKDDAVAEKKHSDFAVEFDLEKPFDGVDQLRFRRIKLVDLKNIWSHEKPSAQLVRFIQDKAEPSLSREQIANNLDAADATGCQDVMNWLLGGFLDEEEADESVFDDEMRPTRGTYDKETRRLQLGFPLFTTDVGTGEQIAVTQLVFSESVPFGRSGALQSAEGWVKQVQAFIRIYGKPALPGDDFFPMTDTFSDQMDATDVLHVFTEVMPEILGKATKKRRFRKL